MNKKDKIDHRVQKTLDCFEKAERIKSNPFFYTRLQARIDEYETKGRAENRQLVWNGLRLAFLVFMVAINILTATKFFHNSDYGYTNREGLVNSFALEFNLDSNQNNPIFLINE